MAERSDAARNRALVLDAAAHLFERHSSDGDYVSLARIASAAGVGKATVLRRFGNLSGLVEALLQPRIVALRLLVEQGPPPLGPGGEAPERLHAYLDALLDFVLDNRPLIRALEHRGPHSYYDNPASRFWIEELGRRIAAVRPDVDAALLAHCLFTTIRADVLDYLWHEQSISVERMRDGLHTLAPGPLSGVAGPDGE